MELIIQYILEGFKTADWSTVTPARVVMFISGIVIAAVLRYFETDQATGKPNLIGKILGIFRSKKQNDRIREINARIKEVNGLPGFTK